MNQFTFSEKIRSALECQQHPFAVFRYVENSVVTVLVSDGFCDLFGYTDREQAVWDMDHDMYRDTHPDDRQRISKAALQFATGDDNVEYDVLFRTKAGVDSDYHVIHAHGKHFFSETGERLAHIWYMDEGTYIEGDESAANGMNRVINSILHEESILRTANYDMLTGLPNLTYFFKRCEACKEGMLREGKMGCLLYIDLNGMKYYNSRYGFAEGDRLLKSVADTIAHIFGHEDSCHISADRFAVSTTEDGLEERIGLFFSELSSAEHHLPARVGIYLLSVEDVPVSTAYDRAKMACDEVSKSETSCFNYYTKALSDINNKRRYIQSNIDRAISEKWIQVYYQPIVRALNSKVCEEEALARWIDPEKGFLSPADFIPYLEESGQIYKLDLYVLEQVLEKMKNQEKAGLTVVPHSINLSRSDFGSCDIVEEIRKRVDDAGIRRDMITVEITESVIGGSLEFMKGQVARFRQLGFPVWLDDFGSGYSSLEVVQSIRFDLLKFDMSFMRRLDESDSARVVLTELMKMAASLKVSTVCEGVEKEEQVRFLQEIGCSKLQGYYFCKPISYEALLERYRNNRQIGYEDPDASDYFETIGSINLYDLEMVASQEEDSLRHSFNSIPVGIVEIRGRTARFLRCNASYRQFMNRFFGMDTHYMSHEFTEFSDTFWDYVAKKCSERKGLNFFDLKLPDGFVLHAFSRWIDTNMKTGDTAVAVAILSIKDPKEDLPLERILSVIEPFGKHMLGGLFVYKADDSEKLMYANKAVCNIFGCDNLEEFKAYSGFTFRGMIHPDDYSAVSDSIRKQTNEEHSEQDFVEFRIIRKDGEIRWVNYYGQHLEVENDKGYYIVFFTDNTDMHQQAESDKALRSAVIEALTKVYDSVWLINDIETQQFELYRIDQEMVHLMPAHTAVKLKKFSEAFAFYSKLVYEEDKQQFLDGVSLENIVRNTENKLIYSVPFRRVFENGIRYYRVEFSKLNLPGGKTGIVTGFRNVDEEVNKELQIQHSLHERSAIIEALTRSYDSVWFIKDMATQQFELFRVDNEMVHLIPTQEVVKLKRYYDAFVFYSKLVHEEDRQRFLEAVTPEKIISNTEGKPIYSVPFRRVFEDRIRFYRVEFARMDTGNGNINIVTGFKNVDDEIKTDHTI